MYPYNRMEEHREYGEEELIRTSDALMDMVHLYRTWQYRSLHNGGIIPGFFAAILPKFMLDNPQLFHIPEGWTAKSVVEDIYKKNAKADMIQRSKEIVLELAKANFYNEKLLYALLTTTVTEEFHTFLIKILPRLMDIDLNIERKPYLLYRSVLDVLPQVIEADDMKAMGWYVHSEEGIACLVSELAAIQDDESVFDGACGLSMLTSLAVVGTRATVFEQDAYYYPAAISRIMMLMIGKPEASVDNADTLVHFGAVLPERKCDIFLIHSPFGFRTNRSEKMEDMVTYRKDEFCSDPRNDQWLFIRRSFQAIKEDGRGIAVMNINALNRDGRQNRDTRAEMVEKGYISAVIELPAGAIGSTSTKWSIVLFDKKGGHDNVYFMDMSRKAVDYYFERNRRGSYTFDETRIGEILDDVKNSADRPGIAKTVSVQEIAEHDYRLSAGTYLQAALDLEEYLAQTVKVLETRIKAKKDFEEKASMFENTVNAYNDYRYSLDSKKGSD